MDLEVALTPELFMPVFDSLVLSTLFPVPALEAFDGATMRLSGFTLQCELFYDCVLEPEPTGWCWIQFMLSRLTVNAV